MSLRSVLLCVCVVFVTVTFGAPSMQKRHAPNRDERFQIKDAEFQSVGCWADSIDQRMLLPMDGKHPLLMDGDGVNRANALMKCAEAASDLRLKVFAIQNGGECMGEQEGERKYTKLGMSTACHADGLGGPYANEVYRFLGHSVKGKDGMYSDWQDWGGCSAKCGEGTMSRVRTCTDPAPYGGGKDCSRLGPPMESRKCVSEKC